jgi:hypothetical protein
MDGLFSPESRSALRPLFSPLLVRASIVQSAAGLCFAGQAIWAALLTQRNIEEAVKAAASNRALGCKAARVTWFQDVA